MDSSTKAIARPRRGSGDAQPPGRAHGAGPGDIGPLLPLLVLALLWLADCNDAELTGTLTLTLPLPSGAAPPAALVLQDGPADVHDLSSGGMIGRIRVEGSDMATVERLFPTAADIGPDGDTLVVSSISVPAGDDRSISGIFYLYEGGQVLTFESLVPTEVSIGPGQTVSVTLPLHETSTVPMTVTLAPTLDWAVRAYPVDGALDVLFPAQDIPSGDTRFTFPALPEGHTFWFRLEDAAGMTVDTVDLPWCTAGAGACTLAP